MMAIQTTAALDHQARLAAGHACLDAALNIYLPLGLSITTCCDPDHVGVGRKHAKECDSPGKMPMHPWKALQTQLPTAAEVEQHWRDFPYGNVGCVLGQVSSMVRIDSDGPECEALLAQWSAGDLPPTWTFRSSPGCRGLLYRWPHDLSCKTTAEAKPGDHKELRLMANGSQTILPPSRHPSGALYAWEPGCSPQDIPLAPAPVWLVERLRQEPQKERTRQDADTHEAPEFARVASALACIPNNDADYETWRELGMALQATEAAWARDLWDSWSRQSGKFNEDKQEKSWRSFTSDGKVQIGSLFHHAQQHGWRAPRASLSVNGTAPGTQQHSASGAAHAVVVTMADVEAKPVEWLWWPYIAIGAVCMFDGDPGIGKTLCMTQIAASLSLNYPLPDQQGIPTLPTGGPHTTLLLSTEDSLAHTLKPRLEAAGADCSKIHVLTGWVDEQGQERVFTLQYLPFLEQEMQKYQPRLVVIDPVTAYMGKIDIHRANEVQELMGQLNRLADRYRCAIVCIRHPSKPGQHISKVIHRGLGSVGFIGTARTALFVEQHPTNPTKVLLGQSKNNMERMGRTQVFSKGEGRFEWAGVSRLTADVMSGSGRGPDPHAFLEAVCWLEDYLGSGIPQSSKEIREAAEDAGIAFRTLQRAKQVLQIRAIAKGKDATGQKVWDWQLVSLSLSSPPSGVLNVLDALGGLGALSIDTAESQPGTSRMPSQPSLPSAPGSGVVVGVKSDGVEVGEGAEDPEVSEDTEDSEAQVVADAAPAFSELTASSLWCNSCQQAQPVRLDSMTYYCAACGASVGEKTSATNGLFVGTARPSQGCPQCGYADLMEALTYRKCPRCGWKDAPSPQEILGTSEVGD